MLVAFDYHELMDPFRYTLRPALQHPMARVRASILLNGLGQERRDSLRTDDSNDSLC